MLEIERENRHQTREPTGIVERGGLLGVKTPFFLAIKIRAPLKGPFRGLFGTGPTFTVRGPGNELGASKVQKRATLRPPSAC